MTRRPRWRRTTPQKSLHGATHMNFAWGVRDRLEGPQPSSSGRAYSAVFVVVVVLTAAAFAFAPAAEPQTRILGFAGGPGMVTVTGFAQLHGNWIAFWVLFTNGSGYTYRADIGGPDYDPIIGGTFSVALPGNTTYTVQILGQILGQQKTCTAGTLTLQGSSTNVHTNYICTISGP